MKNINTLNRKPLILLTGCINPNGMTFTKLQDPEKRKSQYLDSIRYYLNHTENLIVFVENSGTDISEEFQNSEDKKRLEIITFFGNNFDRHIGKGYGEMMILKHAFQHSVLIQECVSIFKITGRYKLLNIKSILKSYQKHTCNIMVDLPRQ